VKKQRVELGVLRYPVGLKSRLIHDLVAGVVVIPEGRHEVIVGGGPEGADDALRSTGLRRLLPEAGGARRLGIDVDVGSVAKVAYPAGRLVERDTPARVQEVAHVDVPLGLKVLQERWFNEAYAGRGAWHMVNIVPLPFELPHINVFVHRSWRGGRL
jgi:hypothetical protein